MKQEQTLSKHSKKLVGKPLKQLLNLNWMVIGRYKKVSYQTIKTILVA